MREQYRLMVAVENSMLSGIYEHKSDELTYEYRWKCQINNLEKIA